MKNKAFKIIPAIALLYVLQASVALPHPTDALHCEPLLLNGSAITVDQFAYVNRGMITLVRGGSSSTAQTAVPFYIYLKRGGKIVDAEAYAHNHAVMRYDIAQILESAQAGDQIIIDPSEPGSKVDRTVITVKSTQLLPHFDWSYGLNKKKDNC